MQKVLRSKDNKKIVITIDASTYEIDPEGIKDSTDALQKAIDDCQRLGGGTVFLPAGKYALHEKLVLKTSVMLHGEDKTVLCCYYGRGLTEGMQICMEACTGLLDVTIYYPEQCIENPVPYPPAIRQHGSNSITVENVVFANPWIGIQCGPDANELHFIKNVRMSPLYQGIFMDMTTDIGRMQGVSISPVWYKIYLESEKENKDVERLAAMMIEYMFAHATGVHMARSDWEYGYDISIEGCQIGLLVTSGQDIGPNAQFCKLKITGCQTGIQMHRGNPYGIAVTDSSICSGDQKMRAAIWCDETFDSVLQCYKVAIKGEYEHLVCHEGNGQVSFMECQFLAKADKNAKVFQKAGGLSLLNVHFSSEGTHVKIGRNVGGTQIVGCTTDSQEKLTIETENGAEKSLLYATKPLPLPVKRNAGYTPYPYTTEPEADCLYLVTQYGAIGDSITDDTEAFERALKDAGKTGGYVYVPGGRYRITKPIKVPNGVELRGIAEVPCHTMGGGSVLMVCCGQGEEEGKPFISLEGNCGVRGIVLYHPEQDPIMPKAYPWTIQALGNRCYCIDTVFVNAWRGIDFGSIAGRDHYISYVSGAPIKCGIFVGRNEGGVWIENVQYNPHYWYRCNLPNRPKEDTWKEFWHNQIKYLDAFVYGAVHSLNVLNTFVFAAKNGVRFVQQDGKKATGVMIGHGTDGGECGIRIDSIEDVEFVNTELVTIESPNTRIYLRNAGTGAVFYNTLMWGAPDTAVLMESGTLKMIQTNIVDSGETAFVVEDGKIDIAATYFYRREKQMMIKSGEVQYMANMTVKAQKDNDMLLPPTDVEKNGGIVTEIYNWYM